MILSFYTLSDAYYTRQQGPSKFGHVVNKRITNDFLHYGLCCENACGKWFDAIGCLLQKKYRNRRCHTRCGTMPVTMPIGLRPVCHSSLRVLRLLHGYCTCQLAAAICLWYLHHWLLLPIPAGVLSYHIPGT